jgi:hypothetical protein
MQVPAVIVADVSSMLEWSMIRPPADVALAARKSCPTFEILSEVTIAVANGVFALATSYIGSMDCPVAVRGTVRYAVAKTMLLPLWLCTTLLLQWAAFQFECCRAAQQTVSCWAARGCLKLIALLLVTATKRW